jgi:hypothetical protein
MKIIEEPTKITRKGVTKAVSFGIKQTGLAHILNVLRNQLYSDKIGAVVREYSANAVDANKEVGKGDTPIEITLPSVFDPTFKVRDFGPALNEEEIREVFAMYGESTKRNSNEQIGMLGLGSKSGFAYGDSFLITSFIDGERHTYSAFIDESKLGQIVQLSVSTTQEKDGLEIAVPVSEDDLDEFREKSIKLFKHFKVKPLIHGLSDHEKDGLEMETLFEGEDWKYLKERNHDPVAVMGGIPYSFDSYDIDLMDDPKAEALREIINSHLVLEFEIGDLNITASREALEFTKHTKESLLKKIGKVNSELKVEVEKSFGDCKTMFDAKRLLGEVCDYGSALYKLSSWAKETVTFNGEKIHDSQYNFYKYDYVTVRSTKKTYGGNTRFNQGTTISPRKSTVIVKNDVGHVRGAIGKVALLESKEEGRKVFLINFDEYRFKGCFNKEEGAKQKTEKAICKELGFDAPMLLLSELPKPDKKSSVSIGVRKTHKTFEYNLDSYHYSKWSDRWTPTEIDLDEDEGVYVVINRYVIQRPKDGYPHSEARTFSTMFSNMTQLVGEDNLPDTIVGFTKAASKKVAKNDNWIELHDWVAEQVLKLAKKNNIADKAQRVKRTEDVHQSWFVNQKEMKVITKILGQDHPYVEVQDRYYKLGDDKNEVNNYANMARDWGFKLPKGKLPEGKVDLKALAKQVEEDYPLVKFVQTDTWYDKTSEGLKTLCENMIKLDECN